MLERLLRNHVLANLLFALVLVVGAVSYLTMPRQQDPSINFNWIDITTVMPGAAAEDVEKRITDVLEDGVRNVRDVRFVSSNSREGVSAILVRFNEMDDDTFDERVADLRRELQDKEVELPEDAEDPRVTEITTANAFPTATVLVTGPADDETLRRQAEIARKDLERIKGVDRILEIALRDPELHVDFLPARLTDLGISPADLADTVRTFYRDVAAGNIRVEDQSWLVRLLGTDPDPGSLARLPVLTARGEVPLGSLADVKRGREEASQMVRYQGQPGVILAVTKQPDANVLELVARINGYIDASNARRSASGVRLVLADDQTQITRDALAVMHRNAALGLALVLLVTWLFLGSRIAALTCIGIPFILAGTFWVLSALGHTVNTSVLLGAVIALGMLVDDAVVVVEAVFYRVTRGERLRTAVPAALNEVVAPVTAAVLTTIAAFLPLMLLPGILGKFMFIIPLVVTTALAISLIEAYWMLPAHVLAMNVNFERPSRAHRYRVRGLHWLRVKYSRLLIRVLRHPVLTIGAMVLLLIGAVAVVAAGLVRIDYFASDPIRLFYVNVQMPVGTPLEKTMEKVQQVERVVQEHLAQDETRSVVSYAGQMFTETAPFFGDHYGQVQVTLKPQRPEMRHVDTVIESMRQAVRDVVGPERVYFLRLAGGPPTEKPISVKVRGDDLDEIARATEDIKAFLAQHPAIRDVTDDATPGQLELAMRVDSDAARRSGIDPLVIARSARLLVDGEIVTSMQDQGEKLEVRVRARPDTVESIDAILRYTLPGPDGEDVPLGVLVDAERRRGVANIRHYNFRRAITVEADIDSERIDAVTANNLVREHWTEIGNRYPDIDLEFSGVLDDIQESLDAMPKLFILGVGLMYLILGTQFRSYFQPLMILASVPMAFTGVVLGLLLTGNPLSLFTLYGVVALAGIAVNSAIVLITAANERLASGMSVLHATIYAARRRVVPIVITSATTIAGLFSLATGLGGKSLLWGPVATAIVWGLGFSTVLTLFVVPMLYRLFMGWGRRREAKA